jgi:hypothetical protein
MALAVIFAPGLFNNWEIALAGLVIGAGFF